MQADWEFEVGAGAPIIDAGWAGVVDLRRNRECIYQIGETAVVASLAPALLRLNGASSPVWTAKCDVWVPEAIDPDELDAAPIQSGSALACYIDLLSSGATDWCAAAGTEAFCRHVCGLLSLIPARCCRVDLVVRRAVLASETESLGITAYLSACGATSAEAVSALSAAIAALVDSLCPNPA